MENTRRAAALFRLCSDLESPFLPHPKSVNNVVVAVTLLRVTVIAD